MSIKQLTNHRLLINLIVTKNQSFSFELIRTITSDTNLISTIDNIAWYCLYLLLWMKNYVFIDTNTSSPYVWTR